VFSRTGHEWGAQLPTIAAALRALPVRSAILDGEGVICGPDSVSDFDRMRAVFGRKGSPDASMCWSWTAAMCARRAGTRDAPC
jgi:ATP-dependent DNA ligase